MGSDDDIRRRCRDVVAVFVAWREFYHPIQDSVFATKIGKFLLRLHSHTSIRPSSYILFLGRIPKSHNRITASAPSATARYWKVESCRKRPFYGTFSDLNTPV